MHMEAKKESNRSYTYTKISQLQNGTNKIHVAGVVVLFKPPGPADSKTGKRNCFCTLRIMDDSTDRQQTCTIFNRELSKLPTNFREGDVIFLRRFQFQDQFLIGSNFSSWILFREESADPVTPSANSTVTSTERERALELRAWARARKKQAAKSVSCPDSPTTSGPGPALSNNPNPTVDQSTGPACYRRHHNLSIVSLGSVGALTGKSISVAFCGVVQFFKPPTKSRGTDYFMTLGLLDQSCSKEAVSCTLFNPVKEKLMTNVRIGEIFLLKGAKVSSYRGRVMTTCYKEAIIVSSSTAKDDSYSLSQNEKAAMEQLKEWSTPLLLNTQLSQFSDSHFFNLICRVAAVYTSTINNCLVLTVFDGTTPKCLCEKFKFAEGWIKDVDCQLVLEYSPMLVEVQVSDLCDQISIKPGQYLHLTHVYAKVCSTGKNLDSESATQLTLSPKQNDGMITILCGNESESIDSYCKSFPRPCGPFPVYRQPPSDGIPEPLFSIVGEETKQVCTVQEALESPLEKPVVVEGRIVCFCRGPIEEFCQLRCTMCKTRYVTPRASDPPLPANMECAFCSGFKGDGPFVKFMFVFLMLVKDSTGVLNVCVTAEEGERFLHQVQPDNLYTQESTREKLSKLLYLMTGGNDPFYPLSCSLDFERPLIKCCVKKFASIDGQTKFTLTDTVCQIIT